MARKKLTGLQRTLRATGIKVMRDAAGFVFYDTSTGKPLFLVSEDSLFDPDGNYYEDNLP